MNVPSPLPYLRVNGVEIANAARTMSYVGKGLAGSLSGYFEVAPDYPCALLARLADSPMDSPITDPAPWYFSEFAESADFLGFLTTEIDGALDSTTSRSIQARLGGIQGGQMGPQRQGPRTITVKGYLVASSPAGLEYGRRWLANTLSVTDCDECLVAPLELWASCPPDDGSDDDNGHYYLYDVGLLSGPTETAAPISERSCDVLEIELVLAVENPYLYRAPTVCLPEEIVGENIACGDTSGICDWLFGAPGPRHCCTITPPPFGTVGAIISIEAPSGVGGITISLFDGCEDVSAVRRILVERVPVATTLTIDSAQRQVILTDAAGTRSDGTPYLILPPGETLDWIEVSPCQAATCVCVQTSHPCSGGGDATVEIQTQLRER